MIKKLFTNKNIILFSLICFLFLTIVIMLGLLTPLIIKIFNNTNISLGSSYFNVRTALPTFLIVFLLGLYVSKSMLKSINSLYIMGFILSLTIINIIFEPFKNPIIDSIVALTVPVIIIIVCKIGFTIKEKKSYKRNRSLASHIIHIGILCILLGTVLSSSLKIENSDVYNISEEKNIGVKDYNLKIISMRSSMQGEAYKQYNASAYITTVDFNIYKDGLYEKTGSIDYISDLKWGQPYTTTYIHRGLMEELFIAPRAIDIENGQIDLYSRIVPYINLVWGGICMMVLGIMALLIIEYKQKRTDSSFNNKFTAFDKKYKNILKEELEKSKIKDDNT